MPVTAHALEWAGVELGKIDPVAGQREHVVVALAVPGPCDRVAPSIPDVAPSGRVTPGHFGVGLQAPLASAAAGEEKWLAHHVRSSSHIGITCPKHVLQSRIRHA